MEVLFNQADSSLHFCCRLHSTDTQAAVQQKMRLLCDHLWELKGKTRCLEIRPRTETLIAREILENLSAGHVDDLADFGPWPASDIVPQCRAACRQRGARAEMLSND